MATNFKISTYRNTNNLHLKLMGDLDVISLIFHYRKEVLS